jgi:hypothetical protein
LTGPQERPLPDVVEEARRILEHAAVRSLPLRVVGGVAIRIHGSGTPRPALTRQFNDIDLATKREHAREVTDFISSVGYHPDQAFNAMNAGRRGLFHDLDNGRQLDLFVGDFEMCHRIPIAARLDVDAHTVPLAELLLTKLQIIELNEKDLRDIVSLLVDHEVAEHDADTVNGAYVAQLCADDWGLWRTCKLNIDRTRAGMGAFELTAGDRTVLDRRLDTLWELIEQAPKSRRWRMRARVGDRKRWYEEPEELG